MVLSKIISGGQTGADRAGLDVAIEFGLLHGGWIPKGRRTEDGPLPPKYLLKEHPSRDYPLRTEQNILDSDGTLIFGYGPIKKYGGTALTYRLCKKHEKLFLYVDMNTDEIIEDDVAQWLLINNIQVLNVAGPRSSREPNIYIDVYDFLTEVVTIT